MYRRSYRDLEWDPFYLQPQRYTIHNEAKIKIGSDEHLNSLIRIHTDQRTAVLRMPSGQGKISDSGYDQMVCLAAAIPMCDHIVFRGILRVLRYPLFDEQNGQEGLGLFFRDTMELDSLTGYPYSNMVFCGLFHGKPCIFGRDGITEEDIEHIRTFSSSDHSLKENVDIRSLLGKKLEIIFEKNGHFLSASLTADGETLFAKDRIYAAENLLSSRDPERVYIGFLSARGCEIEIDLDSVYVEYSEPAGTTSQMPILYVSPEGNSLGVGSAEAPYDFQTAIDQCQSGQEIHVLPGCYQLAKDLIISSENCGCSNRRKTIILDAEPGEKAILDFGMSSHCFRINGNCWDISGLTVTKGYGFIIQGSFNHISNCQAVANMETGFLIRHSSIDSPKEEWPSYNLITDCDSYLNQDRTEQNADGFACKIAAGPGNQFLRCKAFLNSDDGFDLFSKNRSIGAVRLIECRSWLNGYVIHNGRPEKSRGNGNGFKLGGSGLAVNHEVIRCDAFGNRGYGFTSNSNPNMRLISCGASYNGKNYVYYFTGSDSQAVHVMENCTEDNRPVLLIMCSSMYGGGAERVACQLACGFSERFQVIYLYIRDKGRTYPLDPNIFTLSIPRIEGNLDFETVMDFRAVFTAWLKETLHVQTAISFMFTMNKLNVKSAGAAKVICSERNNPAKRDPDHMKEIEGIYEAADHVVFQSDTVRDLFSQDVRNHSSIILNPVNVSCKRTETRHRIVNIGRLTRQKNQALLIEAFAEFHICHSNYTLSIYGEGELLQELQMLAESLGLGNAIFFHGHVYNIHAGIADAEMFVLSSDYEGLSNALLECMMMGLPCISTRCEGSTDVIRSGENGILTDIGNKEQLADAMSQLADDPGMRDRLGAQAQITSSSFHSEAVIKQWEDLIEQLMTE